LSTRRTSPASAGTTQRSFRGVQLVVGFTRSPAFEESAPTPVHRTRAATALHTLHDEDGPHSGLSARVAIPLLRFVPEPRWWRGELQRGNGAIRLQPWPPHRPPGSPLRSAAGGHEQSKCLLGLRLCMAPAPPVARGAQCCPTAARKVAEGGYWASSSAGASGGGSSSLTGSGQGFRLILPGSAVNSCAPCSAGVSPMYSSTPHGAVAATSGWFS